MKSKSFFLFSLIVLSLFFIFSCTNFFEGSSLKHDIEETIELANAKFFNVEFQLSDRDAGQLSQEGTKKLRQNEKFELNCTLYNGYVLIDIEVYSKNHNNLTKNNSAIEILNIVESEVNAMKVYTIYAQAKTTEETLFVNFLTGYSDDFTPPKLLLENQYTPDLILGGTERHNLYDKSKYFNETYLSNISNFEVEFYVYEKENPINELVLFDFYDIHQEKSYLANPLPVVSDIEYLGACIYKIHSYIDLSTIPEIPEFEYFSIEITVTDCSIHNNIPSMQSTKLYFYYLQKKIYEPGLVYISSNINKFDNLISGKNYNEEQINEINSNDYYINITHVDEKYLKIEDLGHISVPIDPPAGWVTPVPKIEPKEIYWGYTQDINKISNLKLKKEIIKPYIEFGGICIDPIQINMTNLDYNKKTYIVVKSDMMLNNELENILEIPENPKLLYSAKNDDTYSIAISNFDPIYSYILYAKEKNQTVFKTYEITDQISQFTNIEDDIYFQCFKMSYEDYSTTNYLFSPLSQRITLNQNCYDQDLVPFSEDLEMVVKCLGQTKIGYHSITIPVDSNIYNQFDSVIVNINNELSKPLELSNDNTLSFDIPSKLFYESSGKQIVNTITLNDGSTANLEKEDFTTRCDVTFKLIGIKNNICYETILTISKNNTDVRDNIPPVIPTDYIIDDKAQTITLKDLIYDYGNGFKMHSLNSYSINVLIQGINVNFEKSEQYYCDVKHLIKIPIHFLESGTYKITLSVQDDSYNTGLGIIENLTINKVLTTRKQLNKTNENSFYISERIWSNQEYPSYSFEYFDKENGWTPLVTNCNEWTKIKNSNDSKSITMELPDSNSFIRYYEKHGNQFDSPGYLFFNYKKTNLDFSILNNSILIYSDAPCFIHIITSVNNLVDDPNNWEMQIAQPTIENIPIAGAPATNYNNELACTLLNDDYSQTPYRFIIPWDQIVENAALIIYPSDNTRSYMFKLNKFGKTITPCF